MDRDSKLPNNGPIALSACPGSMRVHEVRGLLTGCPPGAAGRSLQPEEWS